MKISYVNSVCVRNDAISNAIRDEFAFLRQAGHEDIRLFAFSCDDQELPFTACTSISDIVRSRHFLDSDLVIFHFGIYYSLFNLFPISPNRARKVVVFHNITPASLVPPESRWLIEKSFAQLDNIRWADHVICDSRTNLEVLRSRGLKTRASVVPLAVHSALQAPAHKPSFNDGVVRIAFVGRFTQAKGPHELLSAVEAIARDGSLDNTVQLDFIGNLAFSDPTMVASMQRQINDLSQRFGTKLRIRIHGSAPDELKHATLREADIFALPTYHEGFCVPIVEAMASGCRVVAYENSNTPDISGQLATLVRTGDVEQLARALRSEIEAVRSDAWRGDGTPDSYDAYVRIAQQHVQQFSPASVAPAFLHNVSHAFARRN
jgi:glycosyltransferase involved in cell wall biosynthesis